MSWKEFRLSKERMIDIVVFDIKEITERVSKLILKIFG